jgi:type III secretion protein T
MLPGFEEEFAHVQSFLMVTAICMARLAPIFKLVPFMGSSHLNAPIRNAIILSITFLVYPAVIAGAPAEGIEFSITMGLVVVKEIVIGVMLGFLISLIFYMASGVGFIVDNQRGMSSAQGADPLAGETSTPLGNTIFFTLVVLFIAGGGFLSFFGLLIESYSFWPVFSFSPNFQSTAMETFFASQLDIIMYGIAVLGAPMLIICFLVDFGMGMMNRFAPQLNVFFLSMPIKSGLSMVLLIIYWSVLFTVLKQGLKEQQLLLETFKELLTKVT